MQTIEQSPAAYQQTDLPFSESGSAAAPFIYFEEVAVFGCLEGVLRISLSSTRLLPTSPGRVAVDRVIVAHLRMTTATAESLKHAIDGALLLNNPAPSEANN